MAKLSASLFSFKASGSLKKTLTFLKRHRQPVVESYPHPTDAKSATQLQWRHMYQKCTALWHLLSAAEKTDWEAAATPRHMTGYSWFMSQCLRPNPGIYLPLQGGTMQGNIDMATYKLLDLPAPIANQEPTRKLDLAAHAALTTGLHGVGAAHIAAFHSAGQEVSKVIWKDDGSRVLTDANRTATLEWTDLDLTAATSLNANLAILKLLIIIDSIDATGDVSIGVRKNGLTPTYYQLFRASYANGARNGAYVVAFVYIGLDSGQVIEYRLHLAAGTVQWDTYIDVLGYVE